MEEHHENRAQSAEERVLDAGFEGVVLLGIDYPKDADLIWRRQTGASSWEESARPAYKTDFCRDNLIAFDFSRKTEELELEEWML